MKLPAIWKTDTHTDETGRQSLSLEDKLANLRKANGIPETVEIPFRCSHTGERAAHIYTRAHDGEKFRLARTVKIGAAKGVAGWFAGLRRGKAAPPAIRYDVAEFRSPGRKCPYCGSKRFIVNCSECGEASCGGTIEILTNGEELHTCQPGCGARLTLVSADYMQGGKPRSAGALDEDKPKQIGQSKPLPIPDMRPKALPKPPPLLPGPH